MNAGFGGSGFGSGTTLIQGPGEAVARPIIERELEAGEVLRWCCKANPDRLARRQSGAFSFGIPFLLFAIFWTVNSTSMAGFGLFTALGLVFCGIGVWILFAPLRAKAEGQSTFYGLTDRRAIIIAGTSSRTVRSWGQREMNNISRTELPDGTGDIIFAKERIQGTRGRSYYEDVGFFGIRDPRLVESMVRDISS